MGIVIRNQNEGISTFDTEEEALALWLMNTGYKLICMHPKDGTRHLIYHFVITSSIEKAATDFYESKKTSVQDQFKTRIKQAYKLIEAEERNARKSK